MSDTLFDFNENDCPTCGRRMSDAVCGWCRAGEAPTLVRHDAMDTSVKAAAKTGKGTKQVIYDLLHDNPDGLTDMEIEDITGLPHQSASAARRGLVVAGLVEDSGQRRKNSRGNDAAVWRLASPYRKEPHVRRPAVDDRPATPHLTESDIRSCDECGSAPGFHTFFCSHRRV